MAVSDYVTIGELTGEERDRITWEAAVRIMALLVPQGELHPFRKNSKGNCASCHHPEDHAVHEQES